MKAKAIPLENRLAWGERFINLVCFNDNGCWIWSGTTDSYGYGVFKINRSMYKAHRLSVALYRGYCDEDLTVDHLCRNTRCVNPDHLELVPNEVNVLRGESPFADNKRKNHCKNGHPLSGDNLVSYPSELELGKRQCKICHNERSRLSGLRYRSKNKKDLPT